MIFFSPNHFQTQQKKTAKPSQKLKLFFFFQKKNSSQTNYQHSPLQKKMAYPNHPTTYQKGITATMPSTTPLGVTRRRQPPSSSDPRPSV